MNRKGLSLGERIMSIAGVLLLFDLLFLPWHRIELGILTVSRSGLKSPNGFLSLLAALVVAAILARIVVIKFTTIELRTNRAPRTFLGGPPRAGRESRERGLCFSSGGSILR